MKITHYKKTPRIGSYILTSLGVAIVVGKEPKIKKLLKVAYLDGRNVQFASNRSSLFSGSVKFSPGEVSFCKKTGRPFLFSKEALKYINLITGKMRVSPKGLSPNQYECRIEVLLGIANRC